MNGQMKKALLLALAAIMFTSVIAVYAKPGVVFKAVARETFFTNGFTGQGTSDKKSWSGVYSGSKLVVVGQGSLGVGDLRIVVGEVSAEWAYGGHDFSIDVRLVADEDTNVHKYGSGGTLVIGYPGRNLRFEGSFAVDGEVLDTSTWTGYLQFSEGWKPGYDQVVLRLSYKTSLYVTDTSVSLYWSGDIWGTEVVQVNLVYP
jgi:hypothetical protein